MRGDRYSLPTWQVGMAGLFVTLYPVGLLPLAVVEVY